MKICPVCSREYPAERARCSEDGAGLVALVTGAGAPPEDLVGHTVDGRYRIERVIGKGGMGTVYACRHVVVGKAFAMKVLRPGVERSEEVLTRFIREAKTANAIRSRHIAETSDFGQLPSGSFYVVMELLEGEDLTRAMRSGRLGAPALAYIFVQIAETLGLAHAQGIVHRDLKPDNVFLVSEAGDPLFVKLLDFGIAKVLHAGGDLHLTETGVILGTPYYMSPEQARAEHVDHRTDIYSLGVMMYRAFTGRLPFAGDSAMGVLTQHLHQAPELPSRISGVPAPLERVILRCMEKQPFARFQSMHEVAAALRMLDLSPGARVPNEDPTVQEGRGAITATDGGRLAGAGGAPDAGASGRFGPLSAPPLSAPFAAAAPSATGADGTGAGRAPIGGELQTSRGLVTSSTGRVAPVAPSRGPMFVAIAAVTMIAVGSTLALGLFGRRAAPAAAASTAASAAIAVAAPPEATAVAAAPPSAAPEPSVAASGAPPGAASVAPDGGSPAPPPAPTAVATTAPPVPAPHAPRGAAPRPPTAPPATAKRPPEIRSPFD